MYIISLLGGIILFILGWLFLYHKKSVLKLNAFMRNNIFNDVYVLTEFKKIGVFFILMSIIFFYLGFISLK